MVKWYFNQDHIKKISHLLCDKIDELVLSLDVDLERSGDIWCGPCPVHGGDNPMAFNLFCDGYSIRGNWRCFTRHCEKNRDTPPTILGFIKGVLKQKNPNINFYDALMYAANFLKIKSTYELSKINIDVCNVDRYQNILNKTVKTQPLLIKKEEVKKRLIIPPEELIRRGISKDILVEYDIGICNSPGKEMYNRIVVPIYDDKNKYLIGCLGRSIFNKCDKCNKYHYGSCPKYNAKCFAKWINSSNFKASSYLFNYWIAKEEILKTNTVVLVEGPLDALKLIKAGHKNTVAIFGDDISDEQLILLEKTAALNLILLLDNDPPGMAAKKRIRECCGNLYNIIEPEYPKKDIGELQDEEIEKYITQRLRTIH